jgi:hypothetical protein
MIMSNHRFRNRLGGLFYSRFPLGLLPLLCLLTGCPHNDYLVQLTPQGGGLERVLTFYCSDGVNATNGAPDYRAFSAQELAAITALYPAGGVTHEGQRYTARGEFIGRLPSDVGGAGTYVHCATSLGDAGFYTERFRGNDDFAGLTQRHFRAADRLADLFVGWSHQELRREPGYARLHQFLDGDFRNDLKNFSGYWWAGQIAAVCNTNAAEEFIVRFGQYLWERGYFKSGDLPGLFQAAQGNDSRPALLLLQRFVATKLGVPETNPVPASLAFLADEQALNASLDKYLAQTPEYRAKLKEWRETVKTKRDAQRPEPGLVLQDAIGDMIEFDLFGHADHLTVSLALPQAPQHSNGRWDAARQRVLWETDLDSKTNVAHVPFTCYASWAQPDPAFQTNHFGRTLLAGDPLTQYCLWRNGLDAQPGREWDAFLAALRPDAGLAAKLDAFRFPGEPVIAPTNDQRTAASPSAFARELFKTALKE